MTDVVGAMAAVTGIVSPTVGVIIVLLDRNRKWKEIKIAQAKESSLGKTEMDNLRKDVDEYRRRQDEKFETFKMGVVDLLLKRKL